MVVRPRDDVEQIGRLFMLDYRSTVAAAAFAGAVLAACSDPDLPTDLRTSGPPNVTVVTVLSDEETAIDPNPQGIGRIVETATYCRVGDNKRPGLVGLPDIRTIRICPEDLSKPAVANGVAEAVPPSWIVRVVFDKLLDPKVEDLVPVLDSMGIQTSTIGSFRGPNMTQPVTLKCNGIDVSYDGYYVPNGNLQSWPLGPALFVTPTRAIDVPVGASCTVSVKDTVHNKAGESVPADQRDYTFKLMAMALRFSVPDPGDGMPGSMLQDPTVPVDFFFNAALKVGGTLGTGGDTLNLTTLDPATVTIKSGPNLNITADNPDGDPDPAVCGGTGATEPAANIRSYLAGTGAATTSLVMELDVGGPTATPDTVWAPNTTYLITFAAGATVAPNQGGTPAALPGAADYSLCFHTAAPPM
jgi:hypothetical protein